MPDINPETSLSGPKIDRRTTLSLFAAVGATTLAGCSSSGDPASSASTDETEGDAESDSQSGDSETGGTLTAGWWPYPEFPPLDPTQSGSSNYHIYPNVYNSPLTLKPDLTVRGDLATDWEVEDDGKRFVFDLRDDVKFHNGDTFTAADLAFSIIRSHSSDATESPTMPLAEPIDGTGVVVVDDTTLEVTLKEAFAPSLIFMTRGPGRSTAVVNERALEEMGEDQYSITPVGTGPFKVTNHEVGSSLTLEAFDDYHETDENGNALPYLDRVEIQAIQDASAAENAIRSGDIDFLNRVPPSSITTLEGSNQVTVSEAPGANFEALTMNHNVEPFDSRKARRGIAKLIDNEQLVEDVLFGRGVPDQGPINKATGWVWRDDKPDDQNYDPEEGQRLLEEAGAADAEFTISIRPGRQRLAEVVRRMLSEGGISVEVNQLSDEPTWINEMLEGNYEATFWGSQGDPDPIQSMYQRCDEQYLGYINIMGYCNEEFTELHNEQVGELDRDRRTELLQDMEDIVIADAPQAYLFHRPDLVAMKSNVEGFEHITNLRNMHRVRLSE